MASLVESNELENSNHLFPFSRSKHNTIRLGFLQSFDFIVSTTIYFNDEGLKTFLKLLKKFHMRWDEYYESVKVDNIVKTFPKVHDPTSLYLTNSFLIYQYTTLKKPKYFREK